MSKRPLQSVWLLVCAVIVSPLLADPAAAQNPPVAPAPGDVVGVATREVTPPPREVAHQDADQKAPTGEGETADAGGDWIGGKPLCQWPRMSGDWGGIRTTLLDQGVDIDARLTVDWSAPFSGGVAHRDALRAWIDVNVNVDLEKLVGLTGGKFRLDSYNIVGVNGQTGFGSLQALSNIDGATEYHDFVSFLELGLVQNARFATTARAWLSMRTHCCNGSGDSWTDSPSASCVVHMEATRSGTSRAC